MGFWSSVPLFCFCSSRQHLCYCSQGSQAEFTTLRPDGSWMSLIGSTVRPGQGLPLVIPQNLWTGRYEPGGTPRNCCIGQSGLDCRSASQQACIGAWNSKDLIGVFGWKISYPNCYIRFWSGSVMWTSSFVAVWGYHVSWRGRILDQCTVAKAVLQLWTGKLRRSIPSQSM